jgi:AcrR family transcriptional regulator
MPADERRARAARLRAGRASAGRPPARKQQLSVQRFVDTALDLVAAEGYDALTMRRVASALDTGPASLYAHVVNKADLGELLIGQLCSELVLPQPDPQRWRAKMLDLARQIRDLNCATPASPRPPSESCRSTSRPSGSARPCSPS